MGKLVYGVLASLDRYVNGPDGAFGWAGPDEEVHRFANELQRGVETFDPGPRAGAG